MKTPLLATALTAFSVLSLCAQDPVKPVPPTKPLPPSKPGAPEVTGKATVTIDINGKKETREIDLNPNGSFTTDAGLKFGGFSISSSSSSNSNSNGADSGKGEPHPWLGVLAEEAGEELQAQLSLAEGSGLVLRQVEPESPAARAGLQKNDLLVKLDDQLLTDTHQLRSLVGGKKEGAVVRLTYLRHGHEQTAEATISLHRGGDSMSVPLKLSGLLGKTWGGPNGGQVGRGPIIVDKNGKLMGKPDGAAPEDAVKQVEKALRDAGVDGEVIEKIRRALGETMKNAHKSAGQPGQIQEDTLRALEKALRDVAKKVEEARQSAEAPHLPPGKEPKGE